MLTQPKDYTVMSKQDNKADAHAIAQLYEQKMAALNAGDVVAFLATLADSMAYLPPNQRAVRGKENIGAWVTKGFFEPFEVNYHLSNDELDIAGDLAIGVGPFTLELRPKGGGDPIRDEGTFVNILKRQQDGSWKFHRIIFNSDLAPG